MIWSLWPSMIQFDWPNHVQKTNQKNLPISAGKHPCNTSEELQVCQLLCLETQTSEHGAKGSVFTSDLRAFDVEVVQRRGSQRWHVSNHIGLVEVEPRQLLEILQSWQVARDLGPFEVEVRQLPEILQRLNVTRDLGFSEVEDLQVWQFAEARTQGAGDLLAPMQKDLHHFASLPRWLRDPRRGRRSHTSRLCWQISILVVFQKFSVSISFFPKVGYSYPPKNHGKNYRKVCHSAEKSPCHNFVTARYHVVQVRELRFFESQRQQDLLQRRLLATWLHSLHRFASAIHSFTEAAVRQ